MPPEPAPATVLSEPVELRFQQLIEAVVDYGIFILNPQGYITSWNSGAEKLKGYRRSEVLGKHFSIFYEPEAIARGWPQHELKQAVALGRFEDEGWRLRKDGTKFWANVVITAVKDAAGNVSGFTKITRDLTERRNHEEALRLSEERFRLLVQDVRDYGIFMLDPSGIVKGWNAGAHAMKGYSAEEIIGRHFSTFYTSDDVREGKPQRELEIATREGRVEDEGWRVRKDGTLFWANVIITALRSSKGELVGFGKVTRDMTERRKLEDLENSSRRMNEFLAMLAHELRNPLAPIRNSVSVMQITPMENPILVKCRDIIDRQLTHMTRLVDDLLDIGRITTGKVKLRLERAVLADVIARSVETVKPLLESRRHTITVQLPPEPIQLNADSTRLAQVLQNLLVNAARYTADEGRIEVKAELDGGLAKVTVKDNGRGIPAGELEAIFELFRQGDNGKMPDESGLGIGLTLARSLIEMHGGVLSASSEGQGKGSTFEFRLPAVVHPVDATPTEAATGAPRGRRVLVVDDNRDAADSSSEMLRLLEHEVATAYSGEEALEAARRFMPEVVLLDISMPGISGFETLTRLRQLPGLSSATVIAMTGYGAHEDTERTREAGFDGHLTKPAPLERLMELIDGASPLR